MKDRWLKLGSFEDTKNNRKSRGIKKLKSSE
jgi:hypothetical protein